MISLENGSAKSLQKFIQEEIQQVITGRSEQRSYLTPHNNIAHDVCAKCIIHTSSVIIIIIIIIMMYTCHTYYHTLSVFTVECLNSMNGPWA